MKLGHLLVFLVTLLAAYSRAQTLPGGTAPIYSVELIENSSFGQQIDVKVINGTVVSEIVNHSYASADAGIAVNVPSYPPVTSAFTLKRKYRITYVGPGNPPAETRVRIDGTVTYSSAAAEGNLALPEVSNAPPTTGTPSTLGVKTYLGIKKLHLTAQNPFQDIEVNGSGYASSSGPGHASNAVAYVSVSCENRAVYLSADPSQTFIKSLMQAGQYSREVVSYPFDNDIILNIGSDSTGVANVVLHGGIEGQWYGGASASFSPVPYYQTPGYQAQYQWNLSNQEKIDLFMNNAFLTKNVTFTASDQEGSVGAFATVYVHPYSGLIDSDRRWLWLEPTRQVVSTSIRGVLPGQTQVISWGNGVSTTNTKQQSVSGEFSVGADIPIAWQDAVIKPTIKGTYNYTWGESVTGNYQTGDSWPYHNDTDHEMFIWWELRHKQDTLIRRQDKYLQDGFLSEFYDKTVFWTETIHYQAMGLNEPI